VKVVEVNDDALVAALQGKTIGLSWDHIVGIQFAKQVDGRITGNSPAVYL